MFQLWANSGTAAEISPQPGSGWVWLVLLLCAKFESSLSLILKLDYLVDVGSNGLFFIFAWRVPPEKGMSTCILHLPNICLKNWPKVLGKQVNARVDMNGL